MAERGGRARLTLPPTPRQQLEHRYVNGPAGALDARKLSLEQARALRSAPVGTCSCLSCGEPVELAPAGDGGVTFRHHDLGTAYDHDPWSATHRRAVRAVGGRLRELFPSASVAADVHFPGLGYLADIVAVTPRGAKVATEVLATEITPARFQEIVSGLAAEGVAMLWLLSLELFFASGAPSRTVRKVKLGPLHTTLLAAGRSLMFIDPGTQKPFRRPEIILVRPHPDALRLARLGEPQLGITECMIRRYPLSQLRLQAGEICLLTEYDPSAPQPGELPKRLATKLAKREAHRTG